MNTFEKDSAYIAHAYGRLPLEFARALEKGLLVLTAKDKVRLLPALNIPDALLAEGLDILQSILDE